MLTEQTLYHMELEMALYLKREPCEVVITNLPEEYSSVVTMYESQNHIIIVNELPASKLTDLELIASIIHEGRHAYQYEQIKGLNRYKEDPKRINRWKKEFDNYQQPNSLNPSEYAIQEIEIDAISFTQVTLEKLGYPNLDIPKELKKEVEKRIKEIKIN
ncbi:hypothetical protein ACAG96_01040 [Candidatus Izemoplasma sp. B36]|uniref:hypothetical protein n=1 Tax=Candidatus Izemoplasma sp. B36 TaxID=3242468 RepID=UPI00355811FD